METIHKIKSNTSEQKTSKSPLQGTERENISGSEAVMRALACEKVDTIFGYPGGAIMPIYDALYDHVKKVNHILVRHEQGAARHQR